MVNPGGAALKKGKDNHNAQFPGQGTEAFRGRTWNGFCQIAKARVFLLAEIQAIVQFLKHHKLGTLDGSLTDVRL